MFTQFKSILLNSVLVFGLLMIIRPAIAAVYPMPAPGNDIIGRAFYVSAGHNDSLQQLADYYGLSLPEILEANPNLNPNYLLPTGQKVLIPAAFILPVFRKGIVINLAELRLYYFTPDGRYVYTYPVGLGRLGWLTPLASTTVTKKQKNPVWYVPASIKKYVYKETGHWLPNSIAADDPKNPLGHYALYLGLPGYLIHGTNQEWSVGGFVSSGCIRLHNADIQQLFSMVAVGTPVHIIHYPVKAGWQDGKLFLEVRKPVDLNEPISKLNILSVEYEIEEATLKQKANINWNNVEQIVQNRLGVPEYIGQAILLSPDQPANANDDLPVPDSFSN